jgi:hypothetical protein
MTTSFQISIEIDNPPEVVVKALTNPNNHPFWTTDLDKFEVIKGGPEEVGSVAHLHFSQKGRSYIMEEKLVYCEPGRKYISQVTGDTLVAEVETLIHDLGDRSRIILNWKGRGKNLFLRLSLPLFQKRIRNLALEDIKTFKKLVEERGDIFHV